MEAESPDSAEAAERERALNFEDALLLLGEFQEMVDELEEAAGGASEEQMSHARDVLDRLLSSLDELPLSSELARDRLANIESWARVLVSEEEDTETPGPGSIHTLLRDELAELRGLLEYEMTT